MLEWMHDEDVQQGFRKKLLDSTLSDAEAFCESSKFPEELTDGTDLNYAIVDDDDEYLGTISLKDIEISDGHAEYAIALRKCAQGKGIGFRATGLILKKAFLELGLHRVFLSVYEDNEKAVRMYERSGFTYEGEFRGHLKKNGEYVNWKWYGMLEDEYDENRFGGSI